jgi:AcrR family transcriptional regulator
MRSALDQGGYEMKAPRGDSEQTKAEIMKAARRLFAEHGILAVSVRDVAAEAGVTHGLVHHYFGTKEQLTAEVIGSEVTFGARVLAGNPIDGSEDSVAVMRRVLRFFLTESTSSLMLIARAELTGYEPEKMLPEGAETALSFMAKTFGELQAKAGLDTPQLDPALVSVCVGAAMFGLVTMHPWLMTSAGLPPEDYESRIDEIVEIAVAFLAVVIGVRP